MSRTTQIMVISLGLWLWCFSHAHAQLVLGQPTDQIQVHTVEEFILFNSITKTQTSGLQVQISGDSGLVGIVLPVTHDTTHTLVKRAVFKDLTAIQSSRSLTQRKLELSVQSYLLSAIVDDTPIQVKTSVAVRPSSAKTVVKSQNRRQVLDWAAQNGLYTSMEAVDALYSLERTGHRFDLILLQTRRHSSPTRYKSPMIYLKRPATRPIALPPSLAGPYVGTYRISLLSDMAYQLSNSADAPEERTRFRDHLDKKGVKKALKTVPKSLYTFKRAGYLQSFDILPNQNSARGFIEQRAPKTKRPKETARYDPLRIVIPLEVLVLILIGIVWAWNREKFSLRQRRGSRLKLR